MKLLRLVGLSILLVLLTPPVAAQEELGSTAEELKGIRLALDRLVRLEERGRHQDEMLLVLRRIELRERRLGPLEQRLQGAENEQRNEQENIQSLQKMLEQNQERLREEIKDGADMPRSGTRNMLEDIERSLESVTGRSEDTTQRLRALQDEIAEQKEEVEILDDRLTELLEQELPAR